MHPTFTPTATKTPIPPVSVAFTPTATNTPIDPFSIAFLPRFAADPPGVAYEPGGQVTLCYDLETAPPTPPSSYSVSLFKVAAGEQVHLGDYEDDGTGGCVQVNLTGDETGQIVYLMVFFVDGFPVAQAQTFVVVEAP